MRADFDTNNTDFLCPFPVLEGILECLFVCLFMCPWDLAETLNGDFAKSVIPVSIGRVFRVLYLILLEAVLLVFDIYINL